MPNQSELIYHHHISYYIPDRRSLSRTQPQRWLPKFSPTSPTLSSPTILTTPLKSRLPHTSRTNGLSQCSSQHSAASAQLCCSSHRLSSISCTQTCASQRKPPFGGLFYVCPPPPTRMLGRPTDNHSRMHSPLLRRYETTFPYLRNTIDNPRLLLRKPHPDGPETRSLRPAVEGVLPL